MSKKLISAINDGTVILENVRGVEVFIWYRDREGVRHRYVLPPKGTVEISPKLTDSALLKWSNIKDAIRRGDVRIK